MSERAGDDQASPPDEFGLDAVRELLRLIGETDVTELTIERGGARLHIKRGLTVAYGQPAGKTAPAELPTDLAPPGVALSSDSKTSESNSATRIPNNGQFVTSPMVGTFFAAPSPKDQPFVREGDEVHTGDVIGIVEAMKIMNEIESEFTGRVARILVASGQPVEYGQPLMLIEPL